MDRIGYGARIINRLDHVESVLDVGCRDASLADLLSKKIEYFGADLVQANDRVKYVGDIAEVEFGRTFSTVIALDILEHTETLSANFDKLASLSNRHLVVSLPNCADLITRYRFLTRGRLGGKYDFTGTDQLDRHRWVMNYGEIRSFFQGKARSMGAELEVIELDYGSSGRKTVTARVGRLLSTLLPSTLTVGTIIAIFLKPDPPRGTSA